MASHTRRVAVVAGVIALVAVSTFLVVRSGSKRKASAPNALTLDPITGVPSTALLEAPPGIDVSTDEAATASAFSVLVRYQDRLGISDPRDSLRFVDTRVDGLGVRHVRFDQQRSGVPVYGGQVAVHFSKREKDSVFVGNRFVPGVELGTVTPQIDANRALESARQQLTQGELVGSPKLSVYPGKGSEVDGKSARLAWLVELKDPSLPARNIYVVDAADGKVFDAIPRVAEALAREVYDKRQGETAKVARAEGDAPVGDAEVNHLYDILGRAHTYFDTNWSRDSYDDQGSTLKGFVHDTDENAYWDGEKLVFGEGFAVLDVGAHELTHGVTQHTSDLEYFWQSGALNESFSDVFGAMVDSDDWTLGEDLPPEFLAKTDGMRDMADPTKHGQPAHVNDWANPQDCRPENNNGDEAGVHTNSGIPNKAFYNLATAIPKQSAADIFYYSLLNLQMRSGFEDLRSMALYAAAQKFGQGKETRAVQAAFGAVGIDGAWQPPPATCKRPTQFAPRGGGKQGRG